MRNILTEVSVVEDDVTTNYAALCPENERVDQWLYWLMRELTQMTRSSFLRIRNTELTIDRRNVTAVNLTLSY